MHRTKSAFLPWPRFPPIILEEDSAYTKPHWESHDYWVAILNSCLERPQVGIITSHLLSSSLNKKQAIFRFGLVEGGSVKTIDSDPLLPHKGMTLLKMLTHELSSWKMICLTEEFWCANMAEYLHYIFCCLQFSFVKSENSFTSVSGRGSSLGLTVLRMPSIGLYFGFYVLPHPPQSSRNFCCVFTLTETKELWRVCQFF